MADQQLNMRVSDEVAERFRSFCKEQGISQPQGMDSLLSMMELVHAKDALPSRQTEIEGFERHIKAVTDAFVNSLSIYEETEDRVKAQFVSSLKSKEKTIKDLQDQVEAYKTMLVDAQSAQQQSENRATAAEAATAVAEKEKAVAERTSEDKTAIVDMLTAKLHEAETKLAGYDELNAVCQNEKAKVAELQEQMKEAEYAHKTAAMEAEIKVAKEKAAVQEQAAKDREQQERTHAVEIKALYEKMSGYQEEITSLNKSLMEKQSQLQKQQNEIASLNTSLSENQSQLQKQKNEIASLNTSLIEKQDEIEILSKQLSEKQDQTDAKG